MSASSFHFKQQAIKFRANAILLEESISSRSSHALLLFVDANAMFCKVKMSRSRTSEQSIKTFLNLGRFAQTIPKIEEFATEHACSSVAGLIENKSVRSSRIPRLRMSGDAET